MSKQEQQLRIKELCEQLCEYCVSNPTRTGKTDLLYYLDLTCRSLNCAIDDNCSLDTIEANLTAVLKHIEVTKLDSPYATSFGNDLIIEPVSPIKKK